MKTKKKRKSRPMTTRDLCLNVQRWLDTTTTQRAHDMEEFRAKWARLMLTVENQTTVLRANYVAIGERIEVLEAEIRDLTTSVARSADETGFSTQEWERMRELFQAFVDANRAALRERWKWYQKVVPRLQA